MQAPLYFAFMLFYIFNWNSCISVLFFFWPTGKGIELHSSRRVYACASLPPFGLNCGYNIIWGCVSSAVKKETIVCFFLLPFASGVSVAVLRCVCAIFGLPTIDIVGNSFRECSRKQSHLPRYYITYYQQDSRRGHSVSRAQSNGGAYYKMHFQELCISRAPKTKKVQQKTMCT